MRISAIMAVYNSERYIAQALFSILAQTNPVDEIIVVDDGSTDGTAAILQTFRSHAQIISQKNGGPARAFNKAVSAASGDAFAFLDSDDSWVPDKLQLQRAALLAAPDLEAVFGFVRQFLSPDVDDRAAQRFDIPTGAQPGISKNTLLIHRTAFERIGWFNENFEVSEFVDWYARASVLGLRSLVLPEILALRRHHSANTGRLSRAKQNEELIASLKISLDLRRQNRSQAKLQSPTTDQ